MEKGGTGYGDSYILDPFGEIAARSQRHCECIISHIIDTESLRLRQRSFKSIMELGKIFSETIEQKKLPLGSRSPSSIK